MIQFNKLIERIEKLDGSDKEKDFFIAKSKEVSKLTKFLQETLNKTDEKANVFIQDQVNMKLNEKSLSPYFHYIIDNIDDYRKKIDSLNLNMKPNKHFKKVIAEILKEDVFLKYERLSEAINAIAVILEYFIFYQIKDLVGFIKLTNLVNPTK